MKIDIDCADEFGTAQTVDICPACGSTRVEEYEVANGDADFDKVMECQDCHYKLSS